MTEIEIIQNVINTLSKNTKCRMRYASELENFHNRELQARSNCYRLGVIGVTSSGKSTMINSLLGEAILPAAARPSSSQLVSCFHAQNRCAQIFFQDGTSKTFTGATLNRKLMEKYGDEGVNQNNKEKVKQIELSSPNFPFDKNLILVDSPGLDAYGFANHEQLTINSLLPTIDFCIFVTTCKTNSDEKMLNVLNAIAEYEKPVIIAQNMIDSLRPSLDGEKTVADVAQDHRRRVERIIKTSKIKDKSKVHIVQISAINALKARENRLSRKENKLLLETSNYRKLVEVVNKAFGQVRPAVESQRMAFLKKEIARIAKAALDDGSESKYPKQNFEYEGITKDYEAKKRACEAVFREQMESMRQLLNSINSQNGFDEDDISYIRNRLGKCESEICRRMQTLNRAIIDICQKLNVDSRNILTDFRFDKPELHLRKRTEIVKDRYWKEGERHWYTLYLVKDKGKWVYISYPKEVTDVNGTRRNAVNYVEQSLKAILRTIGQWRKTVSCTEEKLYNEIENRRVEYKTRQEKTLDAQVYLQIGEELQKLADTIKCVHSESSPVNATRTDVEEACTFTINDKYGIVSMLKLAYHIRIAMHKAVYRASIDPDNRTVVIGWEEYCESKFLKYNLGYDIRPAEIRQGLNAMDGSATLYHKPTRLGHEVTYKGRNFFILVNATQFGAALKEIANLKLKEDTGVADGIYFVVQDFHEIMNGGSVPETLDNVMRIKNQKDIGPGRWCKVMLLHDNPLYNMAAAEAQVTGGSKQSDEIRILHDLQCKFRYLFPDDRTTRNYMESTIRTIIQKLGKI